MIIYEKCIFTNKFEKTIDLPVPENHAVEFCRAFLPSHKKQGQAGIPREYKKIKNRKTT